MDEAHLDLGVHVGVTLRSLLENRELLNPPGSCSAERIQDNVDLRIRCADRINDGYIRAVKRNEKDEKEGENESFDGSSAFLGPMLWDKTLTDFKLEYVDLDEFLCENGMSCEANQKGDHSHMVRQHHHHHHHHQQQQQEAAADTNQSRHNHLPSSVQYNRNCVPEQEEQQMCQNIPKACESDKVQQDDVPIECKFTQDDLALATVPGHNNFDPTVQSFSEDELKPQPMVKKSKKHFVPDSLKDEKYWMRRQKNNIAAKRSREARRVKENQIVLRASYLEKENHVLREEMEKLRGENKMLRHRLKKYEQ